MLKELAQTQELPGDAELLLGGLPWRDAGLRVVRAVQIPGVEAGEVLNETEEEESIPHWLNAL